MYKFGTCFLITQPPKQLKVENAFKETCITKDNESLHETNSSKFSYERRRFKTIPSN